MAKAYGLTISDNDMRKRFEGLEPGLPRGTVLLAAVLLALRCNEDRINSDDGEGEIGWLWTDELEKAKVMRERGRIKGMSSWKRVNS